MRILTTGATGFIGPYLIKNLILKGHEVVCLSRDIDRAKKKLPFSSCQFHLWDPLSEELPWRALEGVDGIINLMGENIGEKRWNSSQKKRIYNSRIYGTRNLVQGVQKYARTDPKFFISTSAIGIYTEKAHGEDLAEDAPLGQGFLAKVCQDWEEEAKKMERAERTVIFRTGVVLGEDGGVLKKLRPLFKAGLGGPVGTGKQWMSWIHVQDLASAYTLAVENESYRGPLNAVAPHPETNGEFAHILGKVLHRPSVLKVPEVMIKLAMGEMSCLVLDSQRVIPGKLLKYGFHFQYPRMEQALQQILASPA